ncbi:MAG: hypothetical protein GC160_20215 [Acidobacteria bacterium]|nr:hypothetical protein [Acidobacteriota bacterium]
MQSAIESGLGWLLGSGVQEAEGGVHAKYAADGEQFDPVSVHATGRYIQAMLTLGDPEDPRQRELAVRAGRFLLDRAFDLTTDLFVQEFPTGDGVATGQAAAARKATITGCAAALQALVSLWQATGDNAYRECAARCARAIRTRMSRVDGAYFLSYDLDYQSPDFDADAEADQLKVAVAFWRLAEDGGLREFDDAAEQMLRWAIVRHETLLPEWIDRKELVPALERYALFLEGLLPIAHLDSRASLAFQSGLLRLERGVIEANGSSSPQALARLLRLRLYADSFGIIELDRWEAERERDELLQRQLLSDNPRLHGAFVLPRYKAQPGGAEADTESTIVATQALMMWEEVADGGFRDPWQILI